MGPGPAHPTPGDAVTPTFLGRIQTRIFITLVVGGLWTFIVVPFVPTISGMPYGQKLAAALVNLVLLCVLGCVIWEPIYHLLQQFRWEKDWPAFLGLITIVNEGILDWIVLGPVLDWFGISRDADIGAMGFSVLLVSTWLVLWVFVNGPMRILSIRWRFRGGRLI